MYDTPYHTLDVVVVGSRLARASFVIVDGAFGVPYGNRIRVAAVKEKRFTGIQRKPAAWIAL
ncbi:MAG TPA: hypothetical protein VN843_09575 [Anaerolineales bacterium]|nr:hypothetical protein [Anaerolineales bacterium]